MVCARIAVMCAVRRSLKIVAYHTDVYIVVSTHIAVMCAVRHSVERVTLLHINVYIVVSTILL